MDAFGLSKLVSHGVARLFAFLNFEKAGSYPLNIVLMHVFLGIRNYLQ